MLFLEGLSGRVGEITVLIELCPLASFSRHLANLCKTFPQRRSELDLYEADITGNIFDHYGSLFYQYHMQFSRKAAACFEKEIKVDWSKQDTNMFQLIVGGAKSKFAD